MSHEFELIDETLKNPGYSHIMVQVRWEDAFITFLFVGNEQNKVTYRILDEHDMEDSDVKIYDTADKYIKV